MSVINIFTVLFRKFRLTWAVILVWMQSLLWFPKLYTFSSQPFFRCNYYLYMTSFRSLFISSPILFLQWRFPFITESKRLSSNHIYTNRIPPHSEWHLLYQKLSSFLKKLLRLNDCLLKCILMNKFSSYHSDLVFSCKFSNIIQTLFFLAWLL